MKTYNSLSKLGFLNKYSHKFLFIAFLGIHVPLLGLLFYTLFVSQVSTITIVLVILVLTLGATVLTLLVLNNLLEPLLKGKKALKNFIEHNTIPKLPTHYKDEVGEILKNIQFTLENLNTVNKEKEIIAEMISHDMKTPTHQLMHIIDFLKEEGDNPIRRAEHLAILETVVRQQNVFLENMLRMLKSKNLEIHAANFEAFNVAEMVNNIIGDHKSNIYLKNVLVKNDIPQDLRILGHEVSLTEVFSNLLSNAIKFSNSGGEIILNGKTDNKMAIMEIRDFGIGFSPETKNQMFRKFVPGHMGTQGEASTGLGLYLSRNIIETHGGSIFLQSDGLNKGAHITVELPIAL